MAINHTFCACNFVRPIQGLLMPFCFVIVFSIPDVCPFRCFPHPKTTFTLYKTNEHILWMYGSLFWMISTPGRITYRNRACMPTLYGASCGLHTRCKKTRSKSRWILVFFGIKTRHYFFLHGSPNCTQCPTYGDLKNSLEINKQTMFENDKIVQLKILYVLTK